MAATDTNTTTGGSDAATDQQNTAANTAAEQASETTSNDDVSSQSDEATGLGAGTSDDSESQGDSRSTGLGATESDDQDTRTPESYEDFTLSAPEDGEDAPVIDAHTQGAFKAAAKANGMTQEAAQSMAENLHPELVKAGEARIESMRAEWWGEVKQHAELGDPETRAVAKAAYAKAPQALRTILEASGLDHHPGVLEHFLAVGRATSGDSLVPDGGGAATPAANFLEGNALDKGEALQRRRFQSSYQ